jgi:transcription termination/antitermination protein NusA
MRIQNIVNELGGERIDIIPWNEDQARFVANALSPARVLDVTVDEATKTATVIVPEAQLSLAIGKEGQNARLAAKLTGWRVDIKSDAAPRETVQSAVPVATPEETECAEAPTTTFEPGEPGESDSTEAAGRESPEGDAGGPPAEQAPVSAG